MVQADRPLRRRAIALFVPKVRPPLNAVSFEISFQSDVKLESREAATGRRTMNCPSDASRSCAFGARSAHVQLYC